MRAKVHAFSVCDSPAYFHECVRTHIRVRAAAVPTDPRAPPPPSPPHRRGRRHIATRIAPGLGAAASGAPGTADLVEIEGAAGAGCALARSRVAHAVTWH
jgi:hypothetical protein